LDERRVPVDDLVDGVVDDLPQQVVQPGGAGATDVHAGALADGLEALEDGDVTGGVRHQFTSSSSASSSSGWTSSETHGSRSHVSMRPRRMTVPPRAPRAPPYFRFVTVSSRPLFVATATPSMSVRASSNASTGGS